MKEPDRWPLPKFNPGDPKHLHAIGVIAVTFAQFESSIEGLFLHHPANSSVPFDLICRYFFALAEDQRIGTTRKFYAESEADEVVKAAVNNVLDFFNWAHDSRNKILHSERYPPAFGGKPDILYLSKRASKRDHSTRYLALDLGTLRSTADNMRLGIVRSAEINIYLRARKAHGPYDFPALHIPPKIELTEVP